MLPVQTPTRLPTRLLAGLLGLALGLPGSGLGQGRDRGAMGWVVETVPRPDVQCWALVVGISDYRHDTAFLPDLAYAAADAKAFAELLCTGPGFRFPKDHVRLLLDRDATSAGVRRGLATFLASRAGPNDLIVLYLAGHGAPDPRRPGCYYLLTHDTDMNHMFATAVSMRELREVLTEDVAARRAVVISDCCHSGAVGWSRSAGVNASSEHLQRLARTQAGICILTASRTGELSQEAPDLQHGVFTYYLLQALRERAADADKDGSVTLSEVHDFVFDRVRHKTKAAQHPSLYGDGDFDLPLAGPAGATARKTVPAGALAVVCNVSGAEIRLDGQLAGRTSESCVCVIRRLTPGRHELTVDKEGYAPFRRTCEIRQDQPLQVEAQLDTQTQLAANTARTAQVLRQLEADCQFYLRSMEFEIALETCRDLLGQRRYSHIRPDIEAQMNDVLMVRVLWQNAVKFAPALEGEELSVQYPSGRSGWVRTKARVTELQGERVFLRMGAKRNEISLRQIDTETLLLLATANLPTNEAPLQIAAGLLCLSREQPSMALARFEAAEKLGAPIERYQRMVQQFLRKR